MLDFVGAGGGGLGECGAVLEEECESEVEAGLVG